MIESRAFKEFDPSKRLYCCAAVAILGGSVIGAGASIFGANKAADAQTAAAQASIANQQQMYAQNRDVLTPFINAGAGQIGNQRQLMTNQQSLLDPNNAGGPLSALNRLTMPGADMSEALAQTPGYQFALSQGLRASNNQLAARGLGGSGGAVSKGASTFAEGLAGNTWQSVVQALQNSYNTQLSGGQNLIGSGQNLLNSGVTAGSALAGVGTNTANAVSGSLGYQGNAQAAGANATGAAISNAALPSSLALSQLMQRNNSGGVYDSVANGGVGNGGYNFLDAQAG